MGFILIAGANDIDRTLLKEPLGKAYEIREAKIVKETIHALEGELDDLELIILDLSMDNREGFSVITLCREKDELRKIPIIAISSEDQLEILIKGVQMGATDYIIKPYAYEIIEIRVRNVLGATKKLDEAQKDKELFKEIAEKDQMTGAYNRDTTIKLVDTILKNDDCGLCAMIFVDIDDFKFYNDEYGHLIGDHVIRRIARVIRSNFRQSDIIGRPGGDEFIIFLKDIPNKSLARRKSRDLIRAFNTNESSIIKKKTPISLGLAFNEPNDKYKDIFERADIALRNSKKRGKGCVTEYGLKHLVNNDSIKNDAIVLISRDRTICHVVEKICENKIEVIEINQIEDMEKKNKFIHKNIKLIYFDLSRCARTKKVDFDIINSIEQFQNVPQIAICKEGNIKQYIRALENGFIDLEMTPVNIDSLRRKTIKYGKIDGNQTKIVK